MKKLLRLVALLWLSFAGYAQKNGSFELLTGNNLGEAFSQGEVTHWVQSHGTPSISSGAPGQGIRAAWMFANAGRSEGIVQNIHFKNGQEYRIKFWVRTNNPFGNFYLKIANGVPMGTTEDKFIPAVASQQTIFNDGLNYATWTEKTLTFIAKADYDQLWIYPKLDASVGNSQQAEIMIDGISIQETCLATVNLLSGVEVVLPCGEEVPYLCRNDTHVFQVTNEQPGITTIWETAAIVEVVSSNDQRITFRITGDGVAWVKAIRSNGITLYRAFKVGIPVIDPYMQFENGAVGSASYLCSSHTGNKYRFSSLNEVQTHQYRIKNTSGQVIYTSSANQNGTSGNINNAFPSDGWYTFEVRGTNTCGTSDWVGAFVEYRNCSNIGPGGPGGGRQAFAVFPNPVNSGNPITFLDITSLHTNSPHKPGVASRQSIVPTTIVLYNQQQQKVFTTTFKKNRHPLNMGQLKAGMYYMVVQKGGQSSIKKILIK